MKLRAALRRLYNVSGALLQSYQCLGNVNEPRTDTAFGSPLRADRRGARTSAHL